MVWCVGTDHDVKHSRLSMQVSTRAMATKRLSRWCFGFWSRLDCVFFLLLFLLCHPVTLSTNDTTFGISTITPSTGTPNSPTVTGGTTANITTTHSFTNNGHSDSSTVTLTTSHVTEQNTTAMVQTTATSSNISTTLPAITFTTELHSTDNQTVETTPYTHTGNTTSFETTSNFTFTVNTTSFETTANFTFTVNTTSFETTSNFTFTVNTTSFETTANFTTFTATPEPSSSANITDTTPTINQTLATTAPTPCNFNQSCEKAFYWMTVNVTRTLENETQIQTWLKQLYSDKLNACAVSIRRVVTVVGEVIDGMKSNPNMKSSRSTEKPSFEGMEVTCDPKSSKKDVQCNVLLRLSAPANVCCIRDAVMEKNSENTSVSLVGTIERVGVCADNITQISAGQYDKCDPTVKVDVCNAKPQNISCGNSTNVIFTLDSQDNCTINLSTTTSGTLDAEGLLKLSANASSLNATQVEQILSQLESLLSGPNVSLALANTSVNIVNNLLDVPVAVMTPFSKRAIGVVDTVGLKLVVSGTSQSVLSPSLALAVKKVDGTNFQETSFSLIETSSVQIRSNPSMETEDIMVQVRSTPLGSVILPASLTQNLTAEQQRLASRVQFNFFQKSTFFQDKNLGERKLNSGIVGSSVANLSISGLQKEVLITLRNTGPIPANYVASCVFWDFGLNDGSGGWNSSGCRVLNSSAEETRCACNHLTSFGILLDISKTAINGLHAEILTYITYIGCGISAIFLSVTLLTYLAFGKLRKDIPSKILIQLCLALLLLNLVFLLDAWLALYPDAVGLCISTAFFLHYFLLASFTWMALEAVHMYLALVKVFNTYITRFMVKIGLAGWGIPLVVVIIVIAVNKDHYGLVTYGRYANGATSDFCWIKNDIVFYVAVVAYFCLVFLMNLTMFIVVMIQLCRIKQQNHHSVQNRSSWQEMRSVAGLTMLLGLTWGFAFFAWGPVNLPFMYLFAIFNSLQGFFIFVFYCAMKENVRRQWRTYLCCGSLRLAENSEWSRTATQKINKAPQKRGFSFRSANSNNSSSSFLNHDSLASDGPLGVSNPMDDRIITAGEEPSSGSDVVLNEINDQDRGRRS